ncbi:MAG: sulfite exporter TauE/SafE family protein [Chloroflexi bacterium]|nr:sulfite exporter TauE/SafE family protein [Chloroflexota bacterium]
MPTLLQLVVTAVMMLLGSTVLSTVGFGIGVSTTPVLLLVLDPQSVVVMVNTVSLVLFVIILYQSRQHLHVREMTPVAIAGLLGVPVGVFILNEVNESALRIAITASILALTIIVAFNVRGPIPNSKLLGMSVGFVVGVMLTSLGIGGPIMVIYLLARRWRRDAMRVALSFYFLLVEGTAVAGYAVTGLFTMERAILVLVATPPVLLGFGLALILLRRMNERAFRHAVIVVIISTSLLVLGREALAL